MHTQTSRMADIIEDEMKHCYENLIVVDVGANLTNKKYIRDLDSVIQRAKDSGECFSFLSFFGLSGQLFILFNLKLGDISPSSSRVLDSTF